MKKKPQNLTLDIRKQGGINRTQSLRASGKMEEHIKKMVEGARKRRELEKIALAEYRAKNAQTEGSI